MCGRHIKGIFPYLPVQHTTPQLYCLCAAQIYIPMHAYRVSLTMLAVGPLTSQQLFLVPLQMVVLFLLNPAPPPVGTEGLGTCCPSAFQVSSVPKISIPE